MIVTDNSSNDDTMLLKSKKVNPLRYLYLFFASAKLAISLLITILASSLLGVTLWRGVEAGRVIFSTFWFNSLLVLLVVNIAFCFFGRMWGRRVTIISLGMIMFHLSFVVMLLAIVYNSFYYFRANIRLTEGETLPNSDIASYDMIDKGSLFSMQSLKGETTLIKMHTGYNVDGKDKRAAYQVATGMQGNKTEGIIFITNKLNHNGIDYFSDKEGYSVLLTLANPENKEIYSVFVPLQSLVVGKDQFQYFTGAKNDGKLIKGYIPFPAEPEKSIFALQLEYFPSKLIQERGGEISYQLYAINDNGEPDFKKTVAEGKASIGTSFKAGEYSITAKEIRFWVAMSVRYEPGKPVILTSLWVAFAGIVITMVGRLIKSR